MTTNAKMSVWLKKELEKAEKKRASVEARGQAVAGSPEWNNYVSVGGKITVFKQITDWLKKHPC